MAKQMDKKTKKITRTTAYVLIIVLIIVVIFALFVLNVVFACNSSEEQSNLFTALSGWVSFLATAGVGIITILQSRKYSSESSSNLTQMQNIVKSIDTSIWRSNIPVIVIPEEERLVVESIEEFVGIYNDKENAKEQNNIYFCIFNDKAKRELNKTRLYCHKRIRVRLKNLSDFPVQLIKCQRARVRFTEKHYTYHDVAAYEQGYIGAGESKECVLDIFDEESSTIYQEPKRIEIVLVLGVVDSRGYSQRKSIHFLSNLEKQGSDNTVSGNIIVVWSSVDRDDD